MNQSKTAQTLNQLVADFSQMSAIIHQTHWYMRGPRFLYLHPLMDQYRDEVEAHLDEIAERLITIGGSPFSTLAEFAENSKITAQKGNWDLTVDEHLVNLVRAYQQLMAQLTQGIINAQTDSDTFSEDLLIGIKGEVSKTIWMLQAELGNTPEKTL